MDVIFVFSVKEADVSEKFVAVILPWELSKANEERCAHSTAIAKSKLVGNIPEYVAPELTLGNYFSFLFFSLHFVGDKATVSSDMFSFGLVMYDLFFVLKHAPGGPSTTRPTFLETMKNEGKIDIPVKGKDPNLVKLLTSLLNPNPTHRLMVHSFSFGFSYLFF